MKRFLALFMCVSMLALCACAGQAVEPVAETPAPTAEPTPEPTPELPDNTAEVIALNAPAVFALLERGEEVELMDNPEEVDGYYMVKSEKGFGLVEKQFLRPMQENEYEAWTGYAAEGTKLYTDYYRTDEEPVVLKKNTEVKVLDELEFCYVVEYHGNDYVALIESISKTTGHYSYGGNGTWYSIQSGEYEEGESEDDDTYTTDIGGESGDTGRIGGNGGSGGYVTGVDGGDIVIGFRAQEQPELEFLAALVEQAETSIVGYATVRIDNTPLLGGIYSRGEKVDVASGGEKTTKLKIFDFEAYTETRYLRFSDSGKYEEWICYTKNNAELYDNVYLIGEVVWYPELNGEYTVLEDFGKCYLVERGDIIGYMAKEYASDKPNDKVDELEADSDSTEAVSGTWASASPGNTQLWSDPVL